MTDAVSIACCSSARDTFFLPYSQHYHCLVSITLLFNFTPLQQGNSLNGIDNTTVRNRDLEQAVQIRIFGAFAHLFLLLQYIVGLLPVIFWGLRNNWYQSYNCTIIEIGAQRPQSCPIAWPIKYTGSFRNKKLFAYVYQLIQNILTGSYQVYIV